MNTHTHTRACVHARVHPNANNTALAYLNAHDIIAFEVLSLMP